MTKDSMLSSFRTGTELTSATVANLSTIQTTQTLPLTKDREKD